MSIWFLHKATEDVISFLVKLGVSLFKVMSWDSWIPFVKFSANSIAFCGRGDEKNNYLIESYLKNENDRSYLYDILDEDVEVFIQKIDSSLQLRQKDYNKNKSEIQMRFVSQNMFQH